MLYAHRAVETIIERVESVALHPRMGRKVPEYQHDDIRNDYRNVLAGVLLVGTSHPR